jgi:hypothetical protein
LFESAKPVNTLINTLYALTRQISLGMVTTTDSSALEFICLANGAYNIWKTKRHSPNTVYLLDGSYSPDMPREPAYYRQFVGGERLEYGAFFHDGTVEYPLQKIDIHPIFNHKQPSCF